MEKHHRTKKKKRITFISISKFLSLNKRRAKLVHHNHLALIKIIKIRKAKYLKFNSPVYENLEKIKKVTMTIVAIVAMVEKRALKKMDRILLFHLKTKISLNYNLNYKPVLKTQLYHISLPLTSPNYTFFYNLRLS